MFTFKYGEAPLEKYEHFAGVSLAELQDRPPRQATERTVSLHKDIAREFNTIQKLFDEWERDMLKKRNEALHTIDFPDLDQALTLFNFFGERRIGHIALQDYFFTRRRASASASSVAAPSLHSPNQPFDHEVGDVCTRCGNHIRRHAEFFVDTAKRRSEADRLCRSCLVFSAHQVFRGAGLLNDDQAVTELGREVQRLRDMKWMPRINIELADMLLDSRTFFS